jgi:hypothetical protein
MSRIQNQSLGFAPVFTRDPPSWSICAASSTILSTMTFAGRTSSMRAETFPMSHGLWYRQKKKKATGQIDSPSLDRFFGMFLEFCVMGDNTLGCQFLNFCLSVCFPGGKMSTRDQCSSEKHVTSLPRRVFSVLSEADQ